MVTSEGRIAKTIGATDFRSSNSIKNGNPIYTEKNNCQDCYKCLRQCPVKAIKVEESNASIIPSECIYCGHCVEVCPVGAKKVRDDFSLLQSAIDRGEKVIACLAPSWVSEFDGMSGRTIERVLKAAGFNGVSETALGAEIVAKETSRYIDRSPESIFISSCCPSVVLLINKYYPTLAGNIVPLLSPMQSHARMLKDIYGQEIRIAFFGPCISKKTENEHADGLTDFVLTFNDLHDIIDTYSSIPDDDSVDGGDYFIPFRAGKGSYFPVDGGMIANMKASPSMTDTTYMSFSGVTKIREVLNDLLDGKLKAPLFLELMVCEGGCIKGPCTISKSSEAVKKQQVIQSLEKAGMAGSEKSVRADIAFDQNYRDPLSVPDETESDISNALKASGKFSDADELNCGGCGYDSCRDFAIAMLRGKAERIMCLSYTRRVAQDKASVLLKKIPYGVVVVDDNLKVIDSNTLFSTIIGGDLPEINESLGGMEGSDLKKTVSFYKLFASVLHSGEEMIERTIKENGLLLNISVITIQPHKIVCGIIRNLQNPEVRKEHVLKATRDVIRQNMEIVQKIAFLLGENAAYTESVLNSVAESVENETINPSE
ncbi:MAG TPA: [Fe-Fe] hydrogenase large subunit C-terminal domain-containing protein [Bacteroidales bacterium]|nr:[Fe-Fe] hydrogenase large subunit C-terminal domain-containing protein [Bacteroidales bacterium]HPT11272.1 [Fe-Fe] hydrogenase large subunit C-terminal domain-containing protein [Bacteroidales bacterium]